MIRAQVTYNREAVIGLTVYGSPGTTLDIMAVIDTGFSDYMTLHPDEIDALELDQDGEIEIVLTNGTSEKVGVFSVFVNWDGQRRPISVQSSYGDHLIGMRMLGGCTITMDVCVDGEAVIETETCDPFD